MDIYGLHSNGFLWYKHPMGCMIFRSKAGKFWALSSAKLLPCQQGILRPPTTARQNVCSTVCFAGKACSSWWYYIYIHIHIYVSVCACLCGIDAQVCIQCMQSVYTGDFWSEWVTHGTIGVSWGKKWLYIYIFAKLIWLVISSTSQKFDILLRTSFQGWKSKIFETNNPKKTNTE